MIKDVIIGHGYTAGFSLGFVADNNTIAATYYLTRERAVWVCSELASQLGHADRVRIEAENLRHEVIMLKKANAGLRGVVTKLKAKIES